MKFRPQVLLGSLLAATASIGKKTGGGNLSVARMNFEFMVQLLM